MRRERRLGHHADVRHLQAEVTAATGVPAPGVCLGHNSKAAGRTRNTGALMRKRSVESISHSPLTDW
jgi:hypothetical protein